MYDYIIIGGGISGLYMQMKLFKNTKNIILLEKNNYFGGRIHQYYDKKYDVSFPSGGARFNKSHTRVIELLKLFQLLDFRKDRGGSSNIEFIDAKKQFSDSFKNENGFKYINKVLNKMKNEKPEILRNLTFSDYASSILKSNELEFMLIASGYSGQLKYMNAYDAYYLFSTGIRIDVNFWGGKYHLLIEKMVNYLKDNGCTLLKNTPVKDVIKNDDIFQVTLNNKKLFSKKVIFCTPKEGLLQFTCLNSIKDVLKNSISCKALCRVYAVFDENEEWLLNFKNKTVVNNALRYIIPMNPKKGLIMISYTDDKYTDYWKNKQFNEKDLKYSIVRLIKQTLNLDINPPKKVYVCYWKCGVAYWNKGVNSEDVSSFVTNPLENTYICGENYSRQQSWVEGALESCDRCLQHMNK